jgi:hypothetical protein
MAKFLVLWRRNLLAPWPTDPAQLVKMMEQMFGSMERGKQDGSLKEWGRFLDSELGYTIAEGTSADVFKMSTCIVHGWIWR